MGASLILTVSESDVSKANNSSKITATLKIKSSGSTWNGYAQDGYIKIDGTKYTFSHAFGQDTTTTLATKSKVVDHNADGSKTVNVVGYYDTGLSYTGSLSTSKSFTCTKIIRQYTVKYNANGGTGAPSSQTKTYGTNLTLRTAVPTRTGYDFQGWATSSSGSVVYRAGGTYSANAAVTLYAVWSPKEYTISFSANGGTGAPTAKTKKYGVAISLPTTKPTRSGYSFAGWATSSTGEVKYSAGATYTANGDATLYAKWTYLYKAPTINIISAYRTATASSDVEYQLGEYIRVELTSTYDSSESSATVTVKCNGTALTQSGTSTAGYPIYRGTLPKSSNGNIVATITVTKGTAKTQATIAPSTSPLRLKPSAVEHGAGTWLGGSLKTGGTGWHNATREVMDENGNLFDEAGQNLVGVISGTVGISVPASSANTVTVSLSSYGFAKVPVVNATLQSTNAGGNLTLYVSAVSKTSVTFRVHNSMPATVANPTIHYMIIGS